MKNNTIKYDNHFLLLVNLLLQFWVGYNYEVEPLYEWMINSFVLSKGKDMCMRTVFNIFKKYAWHIFCICLCEFYFSYIPYSQKACVLDKWPPLPVTSYFSKNLFCRESSFSQNIIFHTGKQIWKISFLLLVLSDYHLLREGKSFKKVVAFWEDREVQL